MSKIDKTLQVEGMTCSHCENSIKKSVGELNGVSSVDVNLKEKTVAVSYEDESVTLEVIKETIEDQGYDVK